MKKVYFVRIPHQMPVTVGMCDDTRNECENDIEHDDWKFWNDSHATYTFDTIREMIEWSQNYRGHQWIKIRPTMRKFLG